MMRVTITARKVVCGSGTVGRAPAAYDILAAYRQPIGLGNCGMQQCRDLRIREWQIWITKRVKKRLPKRELLGENEFDNPIRLEEGRTPNMPVIERAVLSHIDDVIVYVRYIPLTIRICLARAIALD
jgi:hypothetical protein